MNDRLQLFFRGEASKVRLLYHKLYHLRRSVRFLRKNIAELEETLSQKQEDSGTELMRRKTVFAKLKRTIDKLESEQRDLRHKLRMLSQQIDSPLDMIGATLKSVINPDTARSPDEIRSEIERLKQKSRELDGKLNKRRKQAEQLREDLQDIQRPIGSDQFAIESLERNLQQARQEITDTNRAIDTQIHATVLTMPMCFLAPLFRESPEHLKKALQLKEVLIKISQLQQLPERTPPEYAPSARGVFEAVKAGTSMESCFVAGDVELSGIGTKHRKVRSGNSTRWKKVDIGFSGSVPVHSNIGVRAWSSNALSRYLTARSSQQFAAGLDRARATCSGILLPELRREAHELTAALRHFVEGR